MNNNRILKRHSILVLLLLLYCSFLFSQNPPPAPISIIGETNVCRFTPYNYSMPPYGSIAGTTVNWTVNDGGTYSYFSGSSINYTWIHAGTKSISVTRSWDDLPACTSTALYENINNILLTGSISGTTPVCTDQTSTYSVITNYPGDTYVWSLSNSNLGSISSGQGSSSCIITWNHITTTTQCNVICVITKCGQSSTNITVPLFQVTIQSSATFSINPSSQTVCDGTLVNFTITSNPTGYPQSGANILWDFGDSYTAPGTSNSIIHTYNTHSGNPSNFNVNLTITNSGCGNGNASATVKVNPIPTVNLSPGGTAVVCAGIPYSCNLTLATSGLGTSPTYVWYDPSLTSNTLSTFSISNTTYPNGGLFYVIVTNTETSCSAQSNTFRVLTQDCNPPCTPVPPSGFISIAAAPPTYCGEGNVTSSVNGNLGDNILSFSWSTPTVPGYVSQSGSPTITSSPNYFFNLPGLYYVYETLNYVNANDPGDPCTLTKGANIEIPMIADFRMYLQCNSGSTGYLLSLLDNTAVDYGYNESSWAWYLDGSTTPFSPLQNPTGLSIPSGTHTITLHVIDDHGDACDATQTLIVPDLPQASFTMSTLDPCSTTSAYRSCEGMAVTFTNTNTPSTIISNIWNFGDGTSSYLQNTARVYAYNSSNPTPPVTLTITDQYGCTSTAQQNVAILKNVMSLSINQNNRYIPQSQQLCPGGNLQPIYPNVLLTGPANPGCNGSNTYHYQWYTGNTPYGNLQTIGSLSGITIDNINTSGAYWVKITDAEGCILNVNPTPATVSFLNAPLANIIGKQDVCYGDNIKLTGSSGVQPITTGSNILSISYLWLVMPNYQTYTTQSLDLNLAPGTYTFTLVTTETINGASCNTASAPYIVTVHDQAVKPTISMNVVDCDTYDISLTATSNLTPPSPSSSFTWSNGLPGSSTDVYAGGAYRVWETDAYGCKDFQDISIPVAPSTYFWRFPTGCYTYCPENLPKQIDRPDYVNFTKWEWMINDPTIPYYGPVPYNGLYQSYGSGICDPLWLDNTPNYGGTGSGTGNYSWILANNLCQQESGTMDVTILDKCCNLKYVGLAYANCNYDLGIYEIGLDLGYSNTSDCPNPSYNIYCYDASNLNVLICPVISGPLPGPNGGSISFSLLTTSTTIIIKVEIICGYDDCFGSLKVELPPCSNQGMKSILQIGKNENTVNNDDAWLKVIPNPATDLVNLNYHFVSSSSSGLHDRMLRITDAVGRDIILQKVTQTDGVYKLDVSQFGQGMYFVELLENNRHLKTERLVVHH